MNNSIQSGDRQPFFRKDPVKGHVVNDKYSPASIAAVGHRVEGSEHGEVDGGHVYLNGDSSLELEHVREAWLPSVIPPIRADKPSDLPAWFEPRDIQWSMLNGLQDSYKSGHKKPILMAMTGTGKTLFSAWLFWRMLRKDPNQRLLFLVPRVSLINQTEEAFKSMGLTPSVIWLKDPRFDPAAQIHIASLDTLWRRVLSPNPATSHFFSNFKFNTVVVDEAHKRSRYIDTIPQGWRIGLTASPFTKGLGLDYDDLIKTLSARELIDSGVIKPLKVMVSANSINRASLKVAANGEFVEKEENMAINEIAGDVIADLKNNEQMQGRTWIAFTRSIDTSDYIHSKMLDAGINAGLVHSGMSTEECEGILSSFKAGLYDGVISIGKLSEGFDNPNVNMVLLLKGFAAAKWDKTRPNNLNGWVQEIGRGRRKNKGDNDCLVVDYGDNYQYFGSPDRFLDGIEKLDKRKPKEKQDDESADSTRKPVQCPNCPMMIDAGNICGSCGHELKNGTALVDGKPVQFLDGKLVMLSNADILLERIDNKKRTSKKDKEAAYAGILMLANDIERAMAAKNQKWAKKKGFIGNLYRNRFNKWPNEQIEPRELKPEKNEWYTYFSTKRNRAYEAKRKANRAGGAA